MIRCVGRSHDNTDRPRRESNPHLRFRKPPFYPLNYGDSSRDQRSDLRGPERPSDVGDQFSNPESRVRSSGVDLVHALIRRNQISTRRRGPTLSCSERPLLVVASQSRTVWSSSCPHSTLRKRECPPRSDEPRGRGSSRQSFSSSVAPPVGGHRSEERRVGKECRSRWSPYP